eukprot:1109729-Prorocentrum_minimum.AAC.1
MLENLLLLPLHPLMCGKTHGPEPTAMAVRLPQPPPPRNPRSRRPKRPSTSIQQSTVVDCRR